ncbi:glycosyltransferase [Pantoea eucrina]|uniref:Glycosyltransferase n=1 Tax=Pantoea eucrina TaxID=472693 RepID=A0ABU5LC55_9GAMM|nr:glycosyltransferase [Pantoea eucrina]MDZ7277296.1 glycosyltransferase [Pantoea eucrina]
MKIPRTLHIVWIGDESKIPARLIASWRDLNPGWQVKVWGNAELASTAWINRAHIDSMLSAARYEGAADMMRYEILFHHGGFAVDADSLCIKPLEDWLFDSQVCASMENEHARPGLIANGYLAAEAKSALIAELIMAIERKQSVTQNLPWLETGPFLLTQTVLRLGYSNLTCWPSHYFIPEHFSGKNYLGSGHVFARQMWGTTLGIQNALNEREY